MLLRVEMLAVVLRQSVQVHKPPENKINSIQAEPMRLFAFGEPPVKQTEPTATQCDVHDPYGLAVFHFIIVLVTAIPQSVAAPVFSKSY